jgi:hypothetical protein
MKYALDVADRQPEGAIFLIPLRLEECEVPQRLRRRQWVDLFQEEGYERLLSALRTRPESLGLPKPKPEMELISAGLDLIAVDYQAEVTEHLDTHMRGLSEEAKRLLSEAAKDSQGTILMVRTFDGLTVQTNGINLVDTGDPRSEARWEKAVDDLRYADLIRDRGHKGEVFQVTADGYRIADRLSLDA